MECTHGGVGDCWRCNGPELEQGLWLVKVEDSDGSTRIRAVCDSVVAAALYIMDDVMCRYQPEDVGEVELSVVTNRGGSIDVHVDTDEYGSVDVYEVEPRYRLITEKMFNGA